MPIPTSWLDWWRRNSRQSHFWFVVAGVVFVTIALVILRKMEHPWEGPTGKRIHQGRPWIAEDFGRFYGFWIGLGTTLLIAIITLTSRWWWSWAHPPRQGLKPNAQSFSRLGVRGGIGLALILAFATWLRAPHLDRPILRDEQDTLRYHIHGFYEIGRKTGNLEFVPVSWADAAFGNRNGNNPVLMSVAAKASLEGWWRLSGVPRDRASIMAVRLPGFLIGLSSIAVIAWCLLGFTPTRVALLGAMIAAIHPLHMEYCLEARGYASVLFGASLALGGAIRALSAGHWRHWACLVGGCAIALYAYLGSLFFVAPLAATVFAILFFRWRNDRPIAGALLISRRDLIRLLVSGLIGFSIYATFAVPPIASFWVHRERFPWKSEFDFSWWLALWTEYTSGTILPLPAPQNESLPTLWEDFNAVVRPFPGFWLGAISMVSVGVFGLIRTLRDPRRHVAILTGVAFLTPFLQIVIHALVTHMILFAFYLIYWLPVLVCFGAIGTDGLAATIASRFSRDKTGSMSIPTWLVSAFVFLGFIYATVGPGGQPAVWAKSPPQTTPEVFTRGDHNWIVYPEGRTLRLDKTLPIPDQFPDSGVNTG